MFNHESFVSRLKIKAVVTTSIEHISSILPQYDIFGIEDAHYVTILTHFKEKRNHFLRIVYGHCKMGGNACKLWKDGVYHRFEWGFPTKGFIFKAIRIIFFAQPFGNVAQVQAIADRICSLTAVCVHCKCGTCEAPFTVLRPDALKEIWKPIKAGGGGKDGSKSEERIYPYCTSSNNRTSSSISSSKYCMPICRGCLTVYSATA